MILLNAYSIVVIFALKQISSHIALSIAKKARLDPRLVWNFTRLYHISYKESLAAKKVILWYKYNKIGYGIAFGCAMESYFRIVKILYILNYNESMSNEQKKELENLLACEVEHVSNNLEVESNNNHLFLNVVSILLSIHQNNKIKKRYSEKYWSAYFSHLIASHFSEQGVHFEGSSSYQLLCAEAISLLLTKEYVSCANGRDIKICKSILSNSLALFPGQNHHKFAVFGDNDNCTSFFAIDSLNARLNQYERIRNAINNIHSTFTTFPISQSFDNCETKEFTKIKLNQRTFFFIMCPEKQVNAKNGHFNNDSPSFSLAFDGEFIFGNSNTFSYTLFRNYFRSSCVKSTIVPCGLDFYDIDLRSKFRTKNTKYVSKKCIGNNQYLLNQSYKGFSTIESTVKVFDSDHSISIRSCVLPGSSQKRYASRFVLHHSAVIECRDASSISVCFPGGCKLVFSANGKINVRQIPVAKRYMHLGFAKRISVDSIGSSDILIKVFAALG